MSSRTGSQCGLVLIDDVPFLAGRREHARSSFTPQRPLDSGRQLVITSDRCPEDLPDLEARLAERFRSGLVVELENPPAKARRAILAKRARLDGVEVSEEVLTEIAEQVSSSVRALEGALIRVVAYASLKGEPATPGLVRHVLRKLGEDVTPTCTASQRHRRQAIEFGVEHASRCWPVNRRPAVARRAMSQCSGQGAADHSLPKRTLHGWQEKHAVMPRCEPHRHRPCAATRLWRNAVDNLRRRG